jgi:16S rRNA (guanine(527)-N(7))-methyltransferase RsmG
MNPALRDIRASVQQVVSAVSTGGTARFDTAGAPVEALARWVDLAERWNERVDLTAARSRAELVDLLIADAVALSRLSSMSGTIVDVGVGAGAPGLGVALLRPDLRITLVEPQAKRVAFLRTVLGTVGRTDVQVVRGRGEEVVKRGTMFDVALSRATLPPPEWLALGDALAPAGSVLVLLAQAEPPQHPGRELVEDVRYLWPLTQVARRIVRYAPRAASKPPSGD